MGVDESCLLCSCARPPCTYLVWMDPPRERPSPSARWTVVEACHEGMWGNFFPKMGEYLPNVTLVCIRMYSLCIQKNSEYTQIHNSRIQKCILSVMYSGVFSKTMNTLEYILIEYNVFYEHFNTQWNTCIPLLHNPVRRRSRRASNTNRIHFEYIRKGKICFPPPQPQW